MDPLAHSLFGAALARTRLGRGVPVATATLVLAANAPDIDVFAYFAGSDTALGFRRGWTHGPIALAVLPPLVVALVALIARSRDRGATLPTKRLIALAYLGAISHPLLDWLNTYGVRLLMPFDDSWFYGDTLFIVDPWMWLLLGAAVVLGRPSRPWARGRERIATALVVAFLLYVGAMYLGARAARTVARAELEARGIGPIEDLMAGPVPIDPFVRDVVAVTEDGFRFARFRWLGGQRLVVSPEAATQLPRDPQIEAAWHDPSIRGFAGWARFPFIERPATVGDRVYFLDARYARRWPAPFGAVAVELGGGSDPATP